MTNGDQQLAQDESSYYMEKVFPIDLLFAYYYSPHVPDFGVWHLTVSEAARLVVLELWMASELPRLERIPDVESVDDPRLNEALEPETRNCEQKLLNAIHEGRLRSAFTQRDSGDQIIAGETYIHCHELFKWLGDRKLIPSTIFAEWIDTEHEIAIEVQNDIKYLRAVDGKGKGELRKLTDRRLFAKYRESTPDDFEELLEMYRHEVRENEGLRNVLVTLRSGQPEHVDRPLAARERRTLLTVIAALCRKLKIVPDDRSAARKITDITEEVGTPISNDTIKAVLKSIPDAVEARRRDSM